MSLKLTLNMYIYIYYNISWKYNIKNLVLDEI